MPHATPRVAVDQVHQLADQKHAVDDAPLEPGCPCPTCARCSRGYLHHLTQVNEPLVLRLATLHNLSFYARLMRELQATRSGAAKA